MNVKGVCHVPSSKSSCSHGSPLLTYSAAASAAVTLLAMLAAPDDDVRAAGAFEDAVCRGCLQCVMSMS